MVNTLGQISNDLLIASYHKAVELKLDNDFIDLLKREIKRREIDLLNDSLSINQLYSSY